MADPNKDPDIVPLPGCGPWLVGRDKYVNPVPDGDYETMHILSIGKCCEGYGSAPFVVCPAHYIGRALLEIPRTEGVLSPGDILYFAVHLGWGTCCGARIAFGAYLVPDPVPECIQLVQLDGLMNQTLRLFATSGPGNARIGVVDPVPWRWTIVECCTERRITYGPGVTPEVTPETFPPPPPPPP